MYDNIRLLLPYPFASKPEQETFCTRFNLFVKDEKKGILHNKGYEGMKQNKGLYIKIELPTSGRKGSFSISFSLHKFYNSVKNGDLYNYDDFNFESANEANQLLTDFLKIDLSTALVKAFEVGINIITPTDPDHYMRELNRITVNGRQMRILEDLHYKEYKQYSTNKDKDKRIVYIFYNKTFEARSKLKDKERRETIPDNVLRVEKDTHRPSEKVYFRQLFDPNFQQMTKYEFKQRFVEDLEFETHYFKTKDITNVQYEIIKSIDKIGAEQTLINQKALLKMGAISNKKYRWFKEQFDEIEAKNMKLDKQISKTSETFKYLIISKINDI
ncbi:MAG: hypothetical protein PHR83_07975 [Paludibacter sp.]|nr:hypothetical protein [Paludibacter sp.]